MIRQLAWLVVLVGLLQLPTGCSHPIDTAIVSSNTVAVSLAATHAEISTRYRAEQIAAAKRVAGDGHDPAVKAQRRDRVQQVRDRWAPVWSAYGIAWHAWANVVAFVELAEQLEGDAVDLAAVAELLAELAAAQRKLLVAIRAAGQPPNGSAKP